MFKKIFKIIFRCIGILIAALIMVYCVIVLNARYILHEALPMIGGIGNAIVRSGSMEPEISVNDLLIIQKSDTYTVGDVVTYLSKNGSLVTHRIIAIDGKNVTTQGDANNVADPAFDVDCIKGKVIAVIPKVGFVLSILQNPLFILAVIITLLLSGFFYRIATRKSKSSSLDDTHKN
ncbi:MAG: signal peptidase I [Acutalibacteraceae bacterium]